MKLNIKNHHANIIQLRNINRPRNDIEKAARFIALNRTCYNGLYRVNSKGLFNVPWGKYKNPVICNSKNLRNVSSAIQRSNAILQVSNYKEILLKNAKEGDFIYLDPPYRPSSSTAYFTRYTDTGFTDKDQRDIANIFEELTTRKCRVMLSNSNTSLIKELYSKLAEDIREVNAIRAINCIGPFPSSCSSFICSSLSCCVVNVIPHSSHVIPVEPVSFDIDT